jgi:succinate dehydrogenase / fumarate reductase, iron-sulfur subunit
MSDKEATMNLILHVWRQKGPDQPGKLETYEARGVNPDESFLEMLDEVNEQLIKSGKSPIAFDHDCREGICGMCSQVINGEPHGPLRQTTVCQLHMRNFKDGDNIYIALTGVPRH